MQQLGSTTINRNAAATNRGGRTLSHTRCRRGCSCSVGHGGHGRPPPLLHHPRSLNCIEANCSFVLQQMHFCFWYAGFPPAAQHALLILLNAAESHQLVKL
jgi:hypothetical protein